MASHNVNYVLSKSNSFVKLKSSGTFCYRSSRRIAIGYRDVNRATPSLMSKSSKKQNPGFLFDRRNVSDNLVIKKEEYV